MLSLLINATKSIMIFSSVTLIAWQAGKWVTVGTVGHDELYLPKVYEPTRQSNENSIPTPSKDMFGVLPTVKKEASLDKTIKKTKLNLLLKGVFPASEKSNGMAIITSKGAKDTLYKVGEKISSNVKLNEVFDSYVIIERSGVKEKLTFPDASNSLFTSSSDGETLPAITQNRAQSAVLPGSARSAYQSMSGDVKEYDQSSKRRDPLIEDLNQMTVKELIDNYESKFTQDPQGLLNSTGLEATGSSYKVVAGSPLTRIGLKVGDEIVSVNGKTVGNVSQDASLASVMRSQGVARIEMRRGARRFFVNYPVR
ncbi:type II secretion system protein N [Marinomonas balearica]|uniref:General secretion pathway protein C n=1 Tax=Marinomonas balearica TaxID=491947 RepID=A0A4R6M566_9GAMM|nr:type II secretion system protein N [Marinomonas balearica]TDO96206.1 general secretion pathway protein C [Marinomonas balearica]